MGKQIERGFGAYAEGQPSMGKQTGKRIQAVGHYEPYMTCIRYPKCTCGVPNPKGFEKCAECGADTPQPTDYREVEAVLQHGYYYPWHARLLLWFAALLHNLANRIKGDD